MGETYLRPAALAYGSDARQGVARGQAGRLGGSPWISFSQVEIIARKGHAISRELVAYGDLSRNDALAAIEMPRAPIGTLTFDRPAIMGIVNVTPDSFSDGGLAARAGDAIAHGRALAEEGADILDVGGESTRPGSEGVGEEEELCRVLPVIKGLSGAGHVVSCDTRKANVMRAAIQAGAAIINDVSALQHDPQSAAAIAELKCPVVLMHAQGDPKTMQLSPTYEDVALDVYDGLESRIAACIAADISRRRIVIDPGIGFGKTFRHNLDVLNQLTLFHGLGVPLLVGLSRKGFVGALTGEKAAGQRVHGSVGGAIHAALNGAHILRVHDVKATVAALAVVLAAADPASSGM
jgi:dihydropteroate synthase